MHVYVIRHAIAEDAAPNQADADRDLTRAGERKFRQVVQGMRALEWRFDRVLASPWLRAARTADLLGPVSAGAPATTPLLAAAPVPELLAMIAETGEHVAVVGHEPWLSELVAMLAFGHPHKGEALQLKKGGVVWLDGTAVPGGMMIRAVLPPKISRALR